VPDNPYAPSPLPGVAPAPPPTAYAPSPLPGVVPSAGPVAPSTLAPSAPAAAPANYKPSPIDIMVHTESGGNNINQRIHDVNTDRGTPARGVAQIIDPTWRTYAPKAGVDLRQYPTAISAPPSLQIQVAAGIPFNQWGPDTVAAVRRAYPNIDIRGKTLGQIQAEAGHAIPNAVSSTPAAAPQQPSSNAQRFADAYRAGNAGGMLAALSAGTGDQGQGKSALDSVGDALKEPQLPAPTPALPAIAQAPPDTSAPSQQLLGQVLANQQTPLSWGSRPFGAQAGPQGGQQVPGVTLNSGPRGAYALNPMSSG
jgi:hypothetical protein